MRRLSKSPTKKLYLSFLLLKREDRQASHTLPCNSSKTAETDLD